MRRPIDLKNNFCQISLQSDLKRMSLGLFEDGRPNKNNNNKISGDIRPVSDFQSTTT